MKVAFLGLGVMGFPMAGHLAAAGHDVCVFNRTQAKAKEWSGRFSGQVADSPAQAASGCEIVFMCLGDDPDVKTVAEELAKSGLTNAIVVDHTTASPALARDLAELFREVKCEFVDAPISGGQAGAENGKLSVMCGGEADAVEKARAVMDAYSARIVHVGPAGHGQLTKAVNQICIAGILQGLAEGVHFAQAAGLDVDKVLEAISGGAAQSWQMDNRAKTMAADQFEFGFAVDWMRKDLRIAISEARANGASVPLAAMVDQYYADIQSMGGGRWDTSSLVRRFKRPL